MTNVLTSYTRTMKTIVAKKYQIVSRTYIILLLCSWDARNNKRYKYGTAV